jgi:hypothetical protein
MFVDLPVRRDLKDLDGVALRVLGVRLTGSVTREGGSNDAAFGAALHERGVGHLEYGALSSRYADTFELGGDAKGVLYRAELQMAMGARWLVTPNSGPMLRLGGRAHIARAADFFTSDVRVPVVQLGWHHTSKTIDFELAAEAAPVLAGHLQFSGENLRLKRRGAFGGLMGISWEKFRLDSEFAWLHRAGEPRIIEWRAALCRAVKASLICVDNRIVSADTGPVTRSNTLGLTWMFGQYDWL